MISGRIALAVVLLLNLHWTGFYRAARAQPIPPPDVAVDPCALPDPADEDAWALEASWQRWHEVLWPRVAYEHCLHAAWACDEDLTRLFDPTTYAPVVTTIGPVDSLDRGVATVWMLEVIDLHALDEDLGQMAEDAGIIVSVAGMDVSTPDGRASVVGIHLQWERLDSIDGSGLFMPIADADLLMPEGIDKRCLKRSGKALLLCLMVRVPFVSFAILILCLLGTGGLTPAVIACMKLFGWTSAVVFASCIAEFLEDAALCGWESDGIGGSIEGAATDGGDHGTRRDHSEDVER